ncbi:MAG: thiamine phosphate synthase [Chlorobi bacterium]|nr:thiamine phosphate synthase [Chlorobiota bacterium]
MKQIAKLHYITQDVENISHSELIKLACLGGAELVQIRIKDQPIEVIEKEAHKAKLICDKFNTKLIINDRVDICKSVGAAGVHLGKSDINPMEAREILGDSFLIGGTANTFEDILRLSDAGVDYIGLGPFRFTKTKKNLSPVLGLADYKTIICQCTESGINIPIIAIGGIVNADINDILNTGIHGIAVSSAISNAGDKPLATKDIMNSINNNRLPDHG